MENLKTISAPVIPPYADMVWGFLWVGRVWMSITPEGRLCWWLAFKREGETGFTWVRFYDTKFLEQYIDDLDIPF